MAEAPGGGDGGHGAGEAWSALATLISGMLVWGGVGYLLDRWLHREALFLPIGLIVGVAAGVYLVYLRYGRDGDGT